MANEETNNVGILFWVIAGAALIWNGMGVMNMIMQMNPENLANYPENHRALIESQPIWAKIGFILSVVGGLVGAVLLLLRKRLATIAFVVSLIGAILALMNSIKSAGSFSAGEVILTMILPVVLAGFWAWYSNTATKQGQLS